MGKTVSAELGEGLEKKFRLVKADMGVKFDNNVLKELILNRYDELTETRFIKVSKGLYNMLERKATGEGKTIQQLLVEVAEK